MKKKRNQKRRNRLGQLLRFCPDLNPVLILLPGLAAATLIFVTLSGLERRANAQLQLNADDTTTTATLQLSQYSSALSLMAQYADNAGKINVNNEKISALQLENDGLQLRGMRLLQQMESLVPEQFKKGSSN